MSLNQVLNKPNSNIRPWSAITSNSITTNNLTVNSDVITNSLLAESITSHKIVASDSLEVNGLYIMSSLESFRDHGYVSDGNLTINLNDNENYLLSRIIDLQGYKINCGRNNSIRGMGLETSGLCSTGLSSSDFIINTNSTLTLGDMAIIGDPLIDQQGISMISSDGLSTCDWTNVNFFNLGSSSGERTLYINNYDNCIFTTLGFISSSNIVFDNQTGHTNSIGFLNSFFQPKTGCNSIVFEPSFNCARRTRISYSAFVGLGDSAINISSDATFNDSGFILDTVNFGGFYSSDGAISGMNSFHNEALWTNNIGINNTAELGEYFWTNNITPTIVSNTSDWYIGKGLPITGDFNQRFLLPASDSTIGYIGSISKPMMARVETSLTSGNNNEVSLAVRKNGVIINNSITTGTTNAAGRAESISAMATFVANQSDIIDTVFRNDSAVNNITVEKLHMLISQL